MASSFNNKPPNSRTMLPSFINGAGRGANLYKKQSSLLNRTGCARFQSRSRVSDLIGSVSCSEKGEANL